MLAFINRHDGCVLLEDYVFSFGDLFSKMDSMIS